MELTEEEQSLAKIKERLADNPAYQRNRAMIEQMPVDKQLQILGPIVETADRWNRAVSGAIQPKPQVQAEVREPSSLKKPASLGQEVHESKNSGAIDNEINTTLKQNYHALVEQGVIDEGDRVLFKNAHGDSLVFSMGSDGNHEFFDATGLAEGTLKNIAFTQNYQTDSVGPLSPFSTKGQKLSAGISATELLFGAGDFVITEQNPALSDLIERFDLNGDGQLGFGIAQGILERLDTGANIFGMGNDDFFNDITGINGSIKITELDPLTGRNLSSIGNTSEVKVSMSGPQITMS